MSRPQRGGYYAFINDAIDRMYYELSAVVPASRFEAWRSRWLPAWLLRHWPIRHKRILAAPQHFNCRCVTGEIHVPVNMLGRWTRDELECPLAIDDE